MAADAVLQVTRGDLSGLQELSEKFGLNSLVLQCRELKAAVAEEAEVGVTMETKLDITYQSPVTVFQDHSTCALNIPVNAAVLVQHLDSGEFSDVDLLVEDYGTVARAHRLILSAWSEPFAKVGWHRCLTWCRLQSCSSFDGVRFVLADVHEWDVREQCWSGSYQGYRAGGVHGYAVVHVPWSLGPRGAK